MHDDKSAKPYPPRWAMIYLLVLGLCLVVWVILCIIHGGPPWGPHPWLPSRELRGEGSRLSGTLSPVCDRAARSPVA